jgi:hypothetical protein
MNKSDKEAIILAPGYIELKRSFNSNEKLDENFKDKIKKLNDGSPNYEVYSKRVQELFKLNEIKPNEIQRNFLAGFIEGEGSISISIKKNKNAKFGVEIDPVFNITQHINGVNHLYNALQVFQTGRIRYKNESNATLVFIIEPRKSLTEKVLPFYEKYVYPFSSPAKKARFDTFKKMLELFNDNAHLDKERFINELLPLWDSMRVQHFEGQTFSDLKEAQDFVRNF